MFGHLDNHRMTDEALDVYCYDSYPNFAYCLSEDPKRSDDLNDRKALMLAQSDVFIALPGGIGTLDELFTVVSSATIGYHQKPLILYNMKGFWDSLIAMLDDLEARGLTRKPWRDYIKVASSFDELKALV